MATNREANDVIEQFGEHLRENSDENVAEKVQYVREFDEWLNECEENIGGFTYAKTAYILHLNGQDKHIKARIEAVEDFAEFVREVFA